VAGIWVIALGQDVDMVGGGIRPGVAGPQRDREQLGGVVAPHTDRVVAEAAFRCCCRVLLFARAADYLAKATEQVFTEHPDAVILTSPAWER